MKWLPEHTQTQPMRKREYRERVRSLRTALLEVQAHLRSLPLKVVVLVGGVDGAGKGETVNLLNEWMDPRWIRTRAFDAPTDEELERPRFWRFWRFLPSNGEIALFLSAWYTEPLLDRVEGGKSGEFAARLEQVRRFEGMLAEGDHLILKFWLHLDKDAQKKRFRTLEKDPLQRWRVSERDWKNWSRYERFAEAAEELLEATHTTACPWIVVDGSDPRRRDLAIADALLLALRRRLTPGEGAEGPLEADPAAASAGPGSHKDDDELLEEEKRSTVGKRDYRRELDRLQGELNGLYRQAREAGTSMIAVFEGRDAAGKGGAIRRIVPALDARMVDVVRVGPPSDEELAHHYLWRFWRRLPRAGGVTLFDRSWYGRVLVERVEGLASERAWRRAYDEINEFELQIVEHGTVLVKCWLEISAEEQARRFEERRRVAYKRWKLTDDDIRNRSLWQAYDDAMRDMLKHTSTSHAPWTVVLANDKRRARLEVLATACRALSERLENPQE